ncbi:TMEM175 family protein [Thiohalorhabdus sp. Cl-TMA]|uniref:TMEM175 family protein n=1 Tax=Thiohalorhabdus methylotrophus TaxID=3242694 RepID=A0ABV4U209_9GAMM
MAQAPEELGAERTSPAFIFPDLDRFNAFSDGVFAIAITLLVLDIPVPPQSEPLVPALVEQWPDFLGYFMSFAFIGSIWLSHASLTRLMKVGDTVAYGANLVLLLFVGLLPFATSLMVKHLSGPDTGIAVALYGMNVLLASLTLSVLIRYVARNPYLLSEDVANEMLNRVFRKRWISIGVNAVGLGVALIFPLLAVALYLAQTILLIIFPLVALRGYREY